MTVSSNMGEFLDVPLDALWGAGQATVTRGRAEVPAVPRGPAMAAPPPRRGHRRFFLCSTADTPRPSPTTAKFWRDGCGEERMGGL